MAELDKENWTIKLTPWETVYYPTYRFFKKFNVKDRYRDVRFRVQRARRGWGDRDVWSFDYYLAETIVGGLTQLRDNHFGVPMSVASKYPTMNAFEPDTDKADIEWVSILNEIIDGFKAWITLADLDYDHKDEKARKDLERKFDRGFRLMHKHFGGLWD